MFCGRYIYIYVHIKKEAGQKPLMLKLVKRACLVHMYYVHIAVVESRDGFTSPAQHYLGTWIFE